jgi:phospholipid/cholesterol/gamma-HCH transport system substrate-binding protein
MAQQTLPWSGLKAGLFVTASLAILATAIIAVGEKSGIFSPSYALTARFQQVDGLKVAAPVWLAGVEVGSVSSIEFVQEAEKTFIDVRFTVNRQFQELIRADSTVTIAGKGLLGDKLLQITPGSIQYAVVPEGGRLVSQAQTDWGALMDQAQSTFDDVGAIIRTFRTLTEDIGEGRGSFGKFVKDTTLYDNLERLAASLSDITVEAVDGGGTLSRLLRDPELYDETAALLRDVRTGEGSLAQLLSNPDLYDDARNVVLRAQDMMGRFENLVGSLEDGDGSAAKVLQSDELHDSLALTLTELQALIADIKANPRRYINFRVF